MGFANVLGKIEELPAALGLGVEVAGVDQLPVTLTKRPLRAEAPGERRVGGRLALAFQEGQQVHAFDGIDMLGAGEGAGGR